MATLLMRRQNSMQMPSSIRPRMRLPWLVCFVLISRIRLLSSPGVTKIAEQVAQSIVETYPAPTKTFRELRDLLHHEAFDPLRAFSEACHEELRTLGSLPRRL
jgi:hypothetical protein